LYKTCHLPADGRNFYRRQVSVLAEGGEMREMPVIVPRSMLPFLDMQHIAGL